MSIYSEAAGIKEIKYPAIHADKINIGLFGFGCVGQGLYDVLNYSQSLKAEIGKICVKTRNKSRTIDSNFFTYERTDVLKNDNHNLIVELIDDADAALEITGDALLKGKDVVTANKKMLAENFELLYKLQLETGSSLLYEGACAGSIPIIRTLEEYYDNELLNGIRGILNGSSNYILTKMESDGLSYTEALEEAQTLGFAESDPRLDVAGDDSKYKLCLLAAHALGLILKPGDILNIGIQNITPFDINYANEKGFRIKLIASAEKSGDKYRIFVLPRLVPVSNALAGVNYEFNAVEVEGLFSDKQFFTGKGAGSHPTASAVLSDISAITYDYKYGYKKLKKRSGSCETDYSNDIRYVDNDFTIKLYIRYNHKSELDFIEIDNIEEEYKSLNGNYIIANTWFKSLFNLYGSNENKLFVCAVN
jgi:homoserine dehydrogenase